MSLPSGSSSLPNCPSCGRPIPHGAVVCAACSTEITQVSNAGTAFTDPVSATSVVTSIGRFEFPQDRRCLPRRLLAEVRPPTSENAVLHSVTL